MAFELNQSRYDQLLRRVGDLKGPGSKVSTALEDVFPTLDVESNRGELQLLSGMRLCVGALSLAPVALNSNRIQVFNPVASGVIAAVTTVLVSSDTSINIRIATTAIALTTGSGVEVFRDRRLGVTSRPTCQIRQDATVALTDANFNIALLAGETLPITDENDVGILPPGSGLEVGTSVVNVRLTATILWRERTVEPSEINF